MLLLLEPLKSKNAKTEKRIRAELGLIFSELLKDDNKKRKRRFNFVKINLLRSLKDKPAVKFRTKRVFNKFEDFLNVFEEE